MLSPVVIAMILDAAVVPQHNLILLMHLGSALDGF